jgi:hypothetical protein
MKSRSGSSLIVAVEVTSVPPGAAGPCRAPRFLHDFFEFLEKIVSASYSARVACKNRCEKTHFLLNCGQIGKSQNYSESRYLDCYYENDRIFWNTGGSRQRELLAGAECLTAKPSSG